MVSSIPVVSIVLPFYRAGCYLAEAVQSILDQDGQHAWELLLIDDGSDDVDVHLAQKFSLAIPDRVRLLQHSGQGRRGISASRNLGIQNASAELIAFLDADDIWYPHRLSCHLSLLRQHRAVDMVYGPALRWWSWMGGEDVAVPTVAAGQAVNCVLPATSLLQSFLADETLTPCIGSVTVRRDLLQQVGGFETCFTGLYDDQVLYAKFAEAGARVYVSSECVSNYRQHARSCCGQAEIAGTGSVERNRFLNWLKHYQSGKATARRAQQLEAAELALSSR